jgi:hypothetical protein
VRTLVTVVISLAVATPAASPLKTASRLSGLRVRHPVPTTSVSARQYAALFSRTTFDARVAKLLALAPKGVGTSPAWYDNTRHRLFVQRGARPVRRKLIHEYVRALADQNFHAGHIERWRSRDRDRWYAGRAMVDGVASLASGLPSPGRALAAQLRYLGGRRAIANAMRTFPQTTEQLLHVDKFLERERALPVSLPLQAGGASLVGSETFGELDVRNLLGPAVAAGWGGGRIALYDDVAVVVLRWDSPEDAAEWQAAVPRYVAAAFPGAVAHDCPPLDRCWSGPGEVAAGVYGTTAVLASGPHAAAVASALL